MDTFYLVDKPVPLTSFFTLKILKKKLDFPKLGHAGTLDPLASGLLLVATGKYTKLLPYLEDSSKEYEFTVSLDGTSPSHDLGEKVENISSEDFTKYKKLLTKKVIQDTLREHFTGTISQTPPKYSAVKVDGLAAFKRTRAGETINLKVKQIQIHSIEILSYSYPLLTLRASVSSGTYVRSIAADLGDILGCGGYVTALRRTKIGSLTLSDAQSVDEFDASSPAPLDKILGKENYLALQAHDIDRLDVGLEVRMKQALINNKVYFIKNGEQISHIVRCDGLDIRPIRKI